MEASHARALLDAERARLTALLDETAAEERAAESGVGETGDMYDGSEPRESEAVDDAVVVSLRERLAAVGRAVQRVEDGTFGRSVHSGEPIPDERLEHDPTAELTVAEATARDADQR